MCLGIPGQVNPTCVEHGVLMEKAEFGGIIKRVCLEHVRHTQVGGYVRAHVGFALQRIDEDEAYRAVEFLAEIKQPGKLGAPSP